MILPLCMHVIWFVLVSDIMELAIFKQISIYTNNTWKNCINYIILSCIFINRFTFHSSRWWGLLIKHKLCTVTVHGSNPSGKQGNGEEGREREYAERGSTVWKIAEKMWNDSSDPISLVHHSLCGGSWGNNGLSLALALLCFLSLF